MKTKKIMTAALAAMVALMFASAPALPAAAGPFDTSTARCNKYGGTKLRCMTKTDSSRGTVGAVIKHFRGNLTIERMRSLNGWSDRVVDTTEIPQGASFAFAGSI
ncbi:hypothetical protein KC926_00110 [Candidatus Kaiserbacteria bacterium]|nr:hypothetical protein [Candidatus Kaiserbacteria bacterium]